MKKEILATIIGFVIWLYAATTLPYPGDYQGSTWWEPWAIQWGCPLALGLIFWFVRRLI
jgi:hypothetical protein